MKFKDRYDFATRINQSNNIMNKCLQEFLLFLSQMTEYSKVEEEKVFGERDFTLGNLMYIIRQHLELTPDIAIYLLIGTKLFPASELLGIIYDEMLIMMVFYI